MACFTRTDVPWCAQARPAGRPAARLARLVLPAAATPQRCAHPPTLAAMDAFSSRVRSMSHSRARRARRLSSSAAVAPAACCTRWMAASRMRRFAPCGGSGGQAKGRERAVAGRAASAAAGSRAGAAVAKLGAPWERAAARGQLWEARPPWWAVAGDGGGDECRVERAVTGLGGCRAAAGSAWTAHNYTHT